MWQNSSPFSLLFFPPCFLSSSLQYSMTRQMLYSTPPFLYSLSSLSVSPTSLLLPSQVACRVRTGFAEAHACWQHTVTDLIAERRKPTEPQCKKPFAETCNVAIWAPVFSPKHLILLFIIYRIYGFDVMIASLHLNCCIGFKRCIYFLNRTSNHSFVFSLCNDTAAITTHSVVSHV